MSIIKIDMAKAKEIHKQRIRWAREPKLIELDADFNKALEDEIALINTPVTAEGKPW